MINEIKLFDQPVINVERAYDNIQKITNSPEDEYTTGFQLDYPYFKEYYRMITIDLSKQ